MSRIIGEVIEFEDMREGDVVEFVEPLGQHAIVWEFFAGKKYSVSRDGDGSVGPADNSGDVAWENFGFKFKLVSKGAK